MQAGRLPRTASPVGRSTGLLRRPRDRVRSAVSGRPPCLVRQAAGRDPERLGQGDRRTVRCGAAGYGRHDASGYWLLLESGRPLHPVHAGQGRQRELPGLRRGSDRSGGRGLGGAAGAGPNALRERPGANHRGSGGRAQPDAGRSERPRSSATRCLPDRPAYR